MGNGACEDHNNNCGCEWDGGDCCGENVVTTYCSVCECLDPNAPTTTTTTTTPNPNAPTTTPTNTTGTI